MTCPYGSHEDEPKRGHLVQWITHEYDWHSGDLVITEIEKRYVIKADIDESVEPVGEDQTE